MRYYLVGFTGCGKSTIGKIIAKELKLKFIDLDREIEKEINMKIPDFFNKYGEEKFRDIETKILKKVKIDNVIIATGGGVILKIENRKYMNENGKVIYLERQLSDILNGLSKKAIMRRPILKRDNISSEFSKRLPLYEEVSDYKVISENKDEIVNQIGKFITMNEWLGKTVKVTVDRPIGYVHKYDIVYPINYGYIDGVMGLDNEYLDAYIVDESKKLDTYQGTVIAVIERLDDVEYKLVVSNKTYTAKEIYSEVEFVEKWFKTVIHQ